MTIEDTENVGVSNNNLDFKGLIIKHDSGSGFRYLEVDAEKDLRRRIECIVLEYIESKLSSDFGSAKNYVPAFTSKVVRNNHEALSEWVKSSITELSGEELVYVITPRLCGAMYERVIKILEESQWEY